MGSIRQSIISLVALFHGDDTKTLYIDQAEGEAFTLAASASAAGVSAPIPHSLSNLIITLTKRLAKRVLCIG